MIELFKGHGEIELNEVSAASRKRVSLAKHLKVSKPSLSLNTGRAEAVIRAGLASLSAIRTGEEVVVQVILPKDIVALGVDGVNKIWREAKQRGAGKKRATTLVGAAQGSIGSKQADQAARMDLWQLLDEYDLVEKQLQEINELLLDLLAGIPDAQRMLAIARCA